MTENKDTSGVEVSRYSPSILEDLVDVHKAAELLHCTVANIRKLHTTGRLPRVHCGRRVLCRISDLEKLLVIHG